MANTIRQLDTIQTILVCNQGPPGIPGPPGTDGVDGVDGSDLNYHHVQSAPLAVWVITHNLNKYPTILVIDSAGSEVTGSIVYNGTNQVTLTFSGGFSGDAYLN